MIPAPGGKAVMFALAAVPVAAVFNFSRAAAPASPATALPARPTFASARPASGGRKVVVAGPSRASIAPASAAAGVSPSAGASSSMSLVIAVVSTAVPATALAGTAAGALAAGGVSAVLPA